MKHIVKSTRSILNAVVIYSFSMLKAILVFLFRVLDIFLNILRHVLYINSDEAIIVWQRASILQRCRKPRFFNYQEEGIVCILVLGLSDISEDVTNEVLRWSIIFVKLPSLCYFLIFMCKHGHELAILKGLKVIHMIYFY